MKKYIYLITLTFLSCLMSSGQQVFQPGIEEPYDYSEISIKLNNWDLARNDWSQQSFQTLIGETPTSLNSSNLDFFSDFRYTQYTYNFSGNTIIVGGGALRPNMYYVDSFELTTSLLDINVIRVGDSINAVLSNFTKNFVRSDQILVYYDDDSIAFHHQNGIITKIKWYTQV